MSDPYLELAAVAASAGPAGERGHALLNRVREIVPFDSAWLALSHPLETSYLSLASVDLDEGTRTYLAGPKTATDIEATGTNRFRPPLSPSDLPFPCQELPTWSECLTPAGYQEALAVGLFGEGGRHVGYLSLLSGSSQPPSETMRQQLQRVVSVVAAGVDPLRALATAARLVQGACAGRVLYADGSDAALPGLPGDALLDASSPLMASARTRLQEGQVYSSFLWPCDSSQAPERHIRATVLASADDAPAAVVGTVILSPATELRGLTPRELEVLGLLIDGCSNQEIAKTLFLSPRTVAAHLEHILVKLNAPTRTLAAVRAEREGLYVPHC